MPGSGHPQFGGGCPKLTDAAALKLAGSTTSWAGVPAVPGRDSELWCFRAAEVAHRGCMGIGRSVACAALLGGGKRDKLLQFRRNRSLLQVIAAGL